MGRTWVAATVAIATAWMVQGRAAALAPPTAGGRLDTSPRHNEWIAVKSGDRTIHTFVVYPEVKDKATVVLLIHENKGLTDWVRGLADEVAEAGYIAVAPDLLSGAGPNGGRTGDFPSVDAATQAVYKLDADQVTKDLDAVADAALKLPAASGKLVVAGFCWGGSNAFRFATHRSDLEAAFVFYGGPPPAEAMGKIACPVYGFYGGNDARVGATIPDATAAMKAAGKTYEPVSYEGAGHGFMRTGEDGTGSDADRTARSEAWGRWMKLMKPF
jgi:carboxymethylenebutenolidase